MKIERPSERRLAGRAVEIIPALVATILDVRVAKKKLKR
jgi:hypothetical protein